jgi:hypothetical protein
MNSSKKTSLQTPRTVRVAGQLIDNRWDKDALFDSFCACTQEAAANWETFFGVDGLTEQVLGADSQRSAISQRLKSSRPWATLMALFDYATQGVTQGDEEMSIVLDAASILSLIRTEMQWPSEEWMEVLNMGDARYALDEGENLTIDRVALLADVDVRTVRNALSAGDLLPVEAEDGTVDKGSIDNGSARRWLRGRRGFKPTVVASSAEHRALDQVGSPAQFGAFLLQQRQRIGMSGSNKVTIFHPSASPDAIAQLEAGLFTLPLDAVFPIADFYQLSRKALLECVMRVFFARELQTLTEIQPQ